MPTNPAAATSSTPARRRPPRRTPAPPVERADSLTATLRDGGMSAEQARAFAALVATLLPTTEPGTEPGSASPTSSPPSTPLSSAPSTTRPESPTRARAATPATPPASLPASAQLPNVLRPPSARSQTRPARSLGAIGERAIGALGERDLGVDDPDARPVGSQPMSALGMGLPRTLQMLRRSAVVAQEDTVGRARLRLELAFTCPDCGTVNPPLEAPNSRGDVLFSRRMCPCVAERHAEETRLMAEMGREQRRAESFFHAPGTTPVVQARAWGQTFESWDRTVPNDLIAIAEVYVEGIIRAWSSAQAQAQAQGQEPTVRARRALNGLPNLLIAGETEEVSGVGKTHALSAMLHRLVDAGIPVCYASAPQVLEALQSTWGRRGDATELDILDHLARVAVLLLDDLGMDGRAQGDGEMGLTWAQRKWASVIDTRYRAMLPTVVVGRSRETLALALGHETFTKLLDNGAPYFIPRTVDNYRLGRIRPVNPAALADLLAQRAHGLHAPTQGRILRLIPGARSDTRSDDHRDTR